MITKSIKTKIVEHFIVYPTSKMRVREIERNLKLPLPSVIRYCKELMTEGILITVRTGDVVFYTANRVNEKYVLNKKLFNIKLIYESGLVEHLRKELSNPSIIVFGSFAKGEDVEESDIDLYVETSSKNELNLEKFEKILKRKIQIFRHKNLKDIGNTNLANNIINGILLNGFVEVFN